MTDPIPPFVPDLPVLKVTWAQIRKLFVEATEVLTGYARGRVLIETMIDRRPADTGPYCTIWFKNLEPLTVNVGDFYFDFTDDEPDAAQVIDNESLCAAQFSFWGQGAYNEATRFMQTLHAQRRFHDLWRIVGFAGLDAIQDVSSEYGGKIQQRAYFTLNFYTCLGRALPADWFDTSKWIVAKPANNNYKESWLLSKEIRDGNTGCLP